MFTNEKLVEELLIQSHSLGITEKLYTLANKMRNEDRTLDFYGSIEKAFHELTK